MNFFKIRASEYLIFNDSLVNDPVFLDELFTDKSDLKDLILKCMRKGESERLSI